MLVGQLLISWTVRVALLCYAVAIVINLAQPATIHRMRIVRPLWTAGALLFVAHVAAAFHFRHHWSHAEAVQSTAVQTEQIIGLPFGQGLWFSYLFVLLWITDAAWSWIQPSAWLNRRPTITLALQAWLFFIAFNGAVIFEAGPTRPAGILVTLLFAVLSLHRLRNRFDRANGV